MLVLVLLFVPLAVYWQSVTTMTAQWPSDAHRHGYLIPFVSLFLLWRTRHTYAEIVPTGSWLGLAWLLLLVALWVVSKATSVQTVEHLAVVAMLSAFVLAVFGIDGYKQVWFPLAFLLCAVPIGDSAIPFLMDSTATIAVGALQLVGVPALREGMVVSLPGGTFEVVEACSGFNYLNVGIALGIVVAHLMFRSVVKQLLYLGAVIVMFVAVNGIRAFLIMLVGSASNMAIGKDHIMFGWVLFLVAMGTMYWLAEKYSDTHLPDANQRVAD